MNYPPREQPNQRDVRESNEQPQQRAHTERSELHEHGEQMHDGDMWSGMAAYRQRFDQLKMDFIEHPKETVAKAEQLANEAVERMVNTMHDRLNHIHSEHGDGKGDTEQMRVAMSHYRELMDSLSSPGRAA